MSTPHIGAKPGEIAEIVLMPGDPLRAKFVADNYLEDVICFNEVRNMLGFTGTYKGKRISVMGHGMGMPSIGIYVSELMMFYGVKAIIRIGTSGTSRPEIQLGDIVMAQGCCTNSDMNRHVFPGTYAPVADYELLRTAYEKAKEMGQKVFVGNISSGDIAAARPETPANFNDFGCMAGEMEGAALYTLAKKHKARALCMVTVSDQHLTKEKMSSQQREQTLDKMIRLALETAAEFA